MPSNAEAARVKEWTPRRGDAAYRYLPRPLVGSLLGWSGATQCLPNTPRLVAAPKVRHGASRSQRSNCSPSTDNSPPTSSRGFETSWPDHSSELGCDLHLLRVGQRR